MHLQWAASVHLIDEFLWGAPAEFHLTVDASLMLALAFMLSLAGLVSSASAGSRTTFGGLALIGLLTVLTDMLIHMPEILQSSPWCAGFISEFLALDLALSGMLTCVTSLRAWRSVG
jgi:hypothetical protein